MEDHDDITDSDDEYVQESETDTEDGMKMGYSSKINNISAHTTPSKARKKTTDILEWKINKKKILRTAGKEYKSGKMMYREKDYSYIHTCSVSVYNTSNMKFVTILKLFSLVISVLTFPTQACDLEQYFSGKQVSVEENTATSRVVFRGLRRTSPKVPTASNDVVDRAITANTIYFELINIYKGSEFLNVWDVQNFRKIAVTLFSRPVIECQYSGETPMEYIVFCDLVETELRAISVARWDEKTDQRIWAELGWSDWSEWSPCSVSCSTGIQQRTRHCKLAEDCQGYNIEQRHCNLFGCAVAVNPLDLNDTSFFHPSKERWQRVPDRLTAWRLKPNSYIWVPSVQLFSEKTGQAFPREFILFITMRLQNLLLTLHELLEEIDNLDDDSQLPDSVVLFPPNNANAENTDEDSGEEDDVTIDNLPDSQLNAPVASVYNQKEDDFAIAKTTCPLNAKFIDFAATEECHSVNESMVPYFGRHGSKQFMKGKPIRWAYKVWSGTTTSGYVEWFEPYQSSATKLPEHYKNLGLGVSVG
ncbi:Thrombospondin type 1 domain [Popillia japonica]|uniref:Thrombospondin type 1 domain n=1 Tax=Popillia japonica TaxID=7064 RepID=A0AAW1K323_POPJA